MDQRKSKKSQGRIRVNPEASETLHALFSQDSDTSLVFSAAEYAANEKGETTTSTSTSETYVTNTCAGVISLPKIVTAPLPPNHDNEADKKDAVTSTGSGAKRSSPPPIKLPLLPTHQIRQPPRRIRSSLRRTPANSNAEKRPPPPIKLPLIPTQQLPKPERIRSSVRRMLPSNSNAEKRSAPSPIKLPAPTAGPPRQPERIRTASLERKATFISTPNDVSGPIVNYYT